MSLHVYVELLKSIFPSIYVDVAEDLPGIDPDVMNVSDKLKKSLIKLFCKDFANIIPNPDKRRPRSELMMSNYTPELRIVGMQMQGVRSYEQHLMNDLVNKFRRRSAGGRRYRHGR